MKIRKLVVVAAGGTAALLIAAGAAFAAWTASGGGTGAGAAMVAQSLVVTPVTPSGANASLYPGGPAGPVYFNIQNPNPYAVNITGIAWGTPTSTSTASCANTNVQLDGSAPTAVTITVPANSSAFAVQINGVLDLVHGAPNGCQGVAFDVSMTITGVEQ